MLQRWLSGWSRARGLPLPVQEGGGLTVQVGWPDQLRRHVFVDAGAALQACASAIHDPFIYIKAAVDSATLRAALPPRWHIEAARTLMHRSGPMQFVQALAPGYTMSRTTLPGASGMVIRTADGTIAASGSITLDAGTAVFDRIDTAEAHRRKGLASVVMLALDRLASEAGVAERLLVATDAGAHLYTHLGWHPLAPWSTAILLGPPSFPSPSSR